jgi:ABC-type branched-subunit amino acid transport system ATPase component
MAGPLRSFRVENQKGLRMAECSAVPSVMVVAGPNGVGKSTLLFSIQRKQGGTFDLDPNTRFIYQPPHRAIRRQQVRRRFLGGVLRTFLDAFSANDVSVPEGISIPFPSRTPDNVDETGSTVKFALGQIENRRQLLITQRYDRSAETGEPLATKGQPWIYEPLADLVSRLLPHLRFRGIDFRNEDDIRLMFDRTDLVGTVTIDLDDLSSGEKSIILLFLPLIEDEIQSRLRTFGGEESLTAEHSPRVFLIDEPEQHLHPDLQNRILGYVRDQAARNGIQFILATHSPTLVDQAFDTELYLLGLPSAAGQNQLRRVTTSAERLDAIRSLAGATYPITTGKTIVCLEGRPGEASSASDIALLGVLWPQSTRYTFVALGSRGHIENVVPQLRARLKEEGYAVDVFGVVDRDRGESRVDGVVTWAVSTIENLLLLTPAPISAAATALLSKQVTDAQVTEYLGATAKARRDDEIRVRVEQMFRPRTLRISKKKDLDRLMAELSEDASKLEAMETEASKAVDGALADGSFVRGFRGKELLRALYSQLGLAVAQVSYDEFAYEIAKRCADAGNVLPEIETVFSRLSSAKDQAIPAVAGAP